MTPFRKFLLWVLKRTDIRITTVYIEYFKVGTDESNPIILQFGHLNRLKKDNV